MSTLLEKLVNAPFIESADLPGAVGDWPEDWREAFEERAAAEQWAETITRAAYHVRRKERVENWHKYISEK